MDSSPTKHSPADQILRLSTEMDVVGEVKMVAPVNYLTVDIMCIFRAEWWIA